MSLSSCDTTVDSRGRELLEHGTVAFPVACYHDDLRENEVPWHWHAELEAAVITEGCAVVAAGNQKYTVYAGEGFFINSGILHGCWNIDTSACRLHSVVFHPRLVGGSIDSVFYLKYVLPLTENHCLESIHLRPSTHWQAEVLKSIEAGWSACVQEPIGFEFKVRYALSELIVLLQSNLPATKLHPSEKAIRDGERIKLMLQFIHEHYGHELNTANIARSASVCESECLRCFRSTIGTTPIQYVRQYRIQQVCQLLTSTQEKISDIAARCGFQDISYFTKVFREAKGMVPSEYRKMHTK
ncbi:MAG: helix-turn-helix transcriptional regulator [Lachnospiraceae bacterium]|nr:helix-turn-helix transcriptional regulator [Lachnospiraceae bacterium]